MIVTTVVDCFDCRAFVLPLRDVVRHMFGDPTFAEYAGVRTIAMLQSPKYRRLDEAHGGAISALANPNYAPQPLPAPPGAGACHPGPGDIGVSDHSLPPQPPAHTAQYEYAHDGQHVENPDARDEEMTAHGEELILLFGLFVDGVQLHQHGRSTTTVFCLKCLDLPAFLVNTDLAAYTIAFIEGPKEPTCMTQILLSILKQFKFFEPSGVRIGDGVHSVAAVFAVDALCTRLLVCLLPSHVSGSACAHLATDPSHVQCRRGDGYGGAHYCF